MEKIIAFGMWYRPKIVRLEYFVCSDSNGYKFTGYTEWSRASLKDVIHHGETKFYIHLIF